MRLGIHLPHIGQKASADAIRLAAVQAEELGFADVWVSEHIIVPRDRMYPPSAIFWDPMLTLTGNTGWGYGGCASLPSIPGSIVCPSPVAYSVTSVPTGAGLSAELGLPCGSKASGNNPGELSTTGTVTLFERTP